VTNFAFSKDLRLLKAKDYKAVFDKSQWKVSNQELLFIARQNGSSTARLGLVIAKKHIRLAVQRNRVKRLIRESFRLHQAQLRGIDVIVLARANVGLLDNARIHTNLADLWLRLTKRRQKSG
jgi:ribonuclease P protein component